MASEAIGSSYIEMKLQQKEISDCRSFLRHKTHIMLALLGADLKLGQPFDGSAADMTRDDHTDGELLRTYYITSDASI